MHRSLWMLLAVVIAVVIAVLIAGHASAQVRRTTRVLGIVANYEDTAHFQAGPDALRKILRKVSSFYAEGSGGAHELVADVRPLPLVLPQNRPAGRCQLPDRTALSTALREANVPVAEYQALVLVVPPSADGCPGGVQTAFGHLQADATVRTVPLAVAWSLTERYVAHEILHTHGMGHANSLQCRNAPLAVRCKVRAYGNTWDLMGHDGGGFQMISAPLRGLIGWGRIAEHGAGSATYTIAAATRPGDQPTALQVRLAFGGNEAIKVLKPLTLWIEYRAPNGFDQRMSRFENFANGAMVSVTGAWQRTGAGGGALVTCPQPSPCLLDMTAETRTFADAGLAVGQSWTEPFTGTRIEVRSRTDAALTVSVSSR